MEIERVRVITPEIVEAFGRLVPQLTHNHPPPTTMALQELVQDQDNALLVVRVPDASGRIVGSGSLGVYRVLSGVRAVIEDVVVEEAVRGQGVGEVITKSLLEIARQKGAPGVSLTSNPLREAANRLYVRLGFELRQTNCYYYQFDR